MKQSRKIQQEKQQIIQKEIRRYRSYSRLVFMTVNICLSQFYIGYGVAYLGTFQFNTILTIYHIEIEENLADGLLQGCIPVGAGVGALVSFLLMKFLSRRFSFIVVNLFLIMFTALTFVRNALLIFVLRFCQGICIGFYSAMGPVMIKQYSPVEVSGSLCSMNQFFITFGVFVANFLQLLLTQTSQQQDHWKIIFSVPLLTASLQTVIYLFIFPYESPKYLLLHQRFQQCLQVLDYIYKPEYVDQVLKQKMDDLDREKYSYEEEEDAQDKREASWGHESHNHRCSKRFYIAITLSMYEQLVGVNTVITYGPLIITQIFPNLSNLIPTIITLEQTSAAFLTIFFLSRYGRKIILEKGTIIIILALLCISLGFLIKSIIGSYIVVLGLAIYMATFGLCIGSVIWVLIPQIIEPSRMSVTVAANWASAALIMILFPIIQQLIGIGFVYLIFAIYCMLILATLQKNLLETKDKQEKQIYQQYQQLELV